MTQHERELIVKDVVCRLMSVFADIIKAASIEADICKSATSEALDEEEHLQES